MIFLLDESNIHKSTGLASIALIALNDLKSMYELDEHVLSIENQLHIHPFHWAGSNWAVRNKFIAAMLKTQFLVRAALTTNPTNIESEIEHNLPYLITESQVHRLIIDGDKPKQYSSRLKRVLRDKGIHITKLRTESDLSRPSLRVADCMAGLIRHHAENPAGGAKHLYRAIKPRIEIIIKA